MIKHSFDDSLSILRNPKLKRESSLNNLLEQFSICLSFVRELAIHHSVKTNSTCPYIRCKPIVFLLLNQFRGHICWSTAEKSKFLTLCLIWTKSKINDLELIFLIKQHIFQFNVSMHNISRVKIFNCLEQLLNNESSFILIKFLFYSASNNWLQTLPIHIFKHKVDKSNSINDFIKSNNLRMSKSFHQFDLLS